MDYYYKNDFYDVDKYLDENPVFNYKTLFDAVFAEFKIDAYPHMCQLVQKIDLSKLKVPENALMFRESFRRLIINESELPEILDKQRNGSKKNGSKKRKVTGSKKPAVTIKIDVPIDLNESIRTIEFDSKKYFFYERAKIKIEVVHKLDKYIFGFIIIFKSSSDINLKQFISSLQENARFETIHWNYFWADADRDLKFYLIKPKTPFESKFKIRFNEHNAQWEYKEFPYMSIERSEEIYKWLSKKINKYLIE